MAEQLALDGAEHAALLAGDEDAVRIWRIVAAIALIDITVESIAKLVTCNRFFRSTGRPKDPYA
jgi:hypothetical protein